MPTIDGYVSTDLGIDGRNLNGCRNLRTHMFDGSTQVLASLDFLVNFGESIASKVVKAEIPSKFR